MKIYLSSADITGVAYAGLRAAALRESGLAGAVSQLSAQLRAVSTAMGNASGDAEPSVADVILVGTAQEYLKLEDAALTAIRKYLDLLEHATVQEAQELVREDEGQA